MFTAFHSASVTEHSWPLAVATRRGRIRAAAYFLLIIVLLLIDVMARSLLGDLTVAVVAEFNDLLGSGANVSA